MYRKVITIFFLLVFGTQLLPIRQVGKLIAGTTMTEELPETGTTKVASGADAKWFLISGNHANSSGLLNTSENLYIYFSETLPLLSFGEVQTPPPDLFS